jgi:uncharacterized protein YecE (DUF72 family)
MKVGLCGFSMSIADYPDHFPVVEVQQTFYQPPAVATMRRWRERMPAGFEFTIKAWQLVTHTSRSPTWRRLRRPMDEEERAGAGAFRPTPIVAEAWQTTVACARLLGASAIVFQCPASFGPTDENVANLRSFFRGIDRPDGVRLLWEPRGPAWQDPLLRGLCAELDLTHVVDPFVRPTVTRGLTYFRLHGTTGARHVYTDSELRQLRAWVPSEGETYVMFNNLPRVGDAKRFEAMTG